MSERQSETAPSTRKDSLRMPVGKESLRPETAPPITSLGAFHVGGGVPGKPDEIEVRFVLTDKAEARAWAVWLFEQQEINDAG